jgi:glycyl-tRNA synthetase
VDGSKAGPAFRQLSQKVKQYVETLPPESNFPITTSIDGTEIEIHEQHVKRVQTKEMVSGEWYIPHVVEPAFGIDRIIWHLIDHTFKEIEKSNEIYNRLELPDLVAPVDVAVLPLFEKDGMDILAQELHKKLCSKSNIFSIYDGSGSIGRRYARADEIGVPFCITVDHDSLVDNTVTIRNRDTTEQERVKIDELPFF